MFKICLLKNSSSFFYGSSAYRCGCAYLAWFLSHNHIPMCMYHTQIELRHYTFKHYTYTQILYKKGKWQRVSFIIVLCALTAPFRAPCFTTTLLFKSFMYLSILSLTGSPLWATFFIFNFSVFPLLFLLLNSVWFIGRSFTPWRTFSAYHIYNVHVYSRYTLWFDWVFCLNILTFWRCGACEFCFGFGSVILCRNAVFGYTFFGLAG